jgi:hypothetical protein
MRYVYTFSLYTYIQANDSPQMSSHLFLIGSIIATVYFLLKFLEMRFVDQDNKKPIKVLIRDTLIVCVSSVIGIFLLDQFNLLGNRLGSSNHGVASGGSSTPAVFVDTPGF